MSYSEKLKDPKWQKKRLEVLSRDEFTCKVCGCNTKTLHVHHFVYDENPWDTKESDLLTLCKDCHGLVHEVEKSGSFGIVLILMVMCQTQNNNLSKTVSEIRRVLKQYS
jgi:5-methylcytosine-specific restriction endonuclease McrA